MAQRIRRETTNLEIAGSNPVRDILLFLNAIVPSKNTTDFHSYHLSHLSALVAQWIAHWTSNPEVAGSNPVKSDHFFDS